MFTYLLLSVYCFQKIQNGVQKSLICTQYENHIYIYLTKLQATLVWMFITLMFRVSTHQINIQMAIEANPIKTVSYQKEIMDHKILESNIGSLCLQAE